MDIQRGDQVYYRGEVWTVEWNIPPDSKNDRYRLSRWTGPEDFAMAEARSADLQRVEQVR